VAFIGEAPAVYQRRSGFAERTLRGAAGHAAAHGVRLVHRPCAASHEAAAGAITRILQDRPATTGLVVQNEAIISPLLSALRTAGRMVPEDMSVVAICPEEVAERTAPHLTSVAIPAGDIGRRAVEMLTRRLADGAASEMVLLPPTLTIRASTGRAAAS
jgi:DNA-binding LacI/PurR family transcriptional regulator